ncbi:24-dehydrocholesterol reductase protein [Rutstroemia sp. NJR-2017a BBW]|nr:24-dehydrocholesterol reductase protein [Rutstroemia sp. NJR-2017a BBW]
MSSAALQNEHGQGVSHATDDSIVPGKVQEKAPEGLERSLPESVHPTGDKNQSTSQSHAKTNADGTTESIVPKKLQEVLPESVERAVPNAIHDTGDQGGVHRKQ